MDIMDQWLCRNGSILHFTNFNGCNDVLTTKITPNTMQDETQKKIFQLLPVIFTFFFLWFPAGLTLYWFYKQPIYNRATILYK